MSSKPIWQSKTFWANGLTTLVAVLGVLQGQEWIAAHPRLVATIVSLVGVANILLRMVTVGPVSLSVILLCLVAPLSAQTVSPEWASYRIFVPGAAGSATGIAPNIAVTNVHVVGGRGTPCVLRHTPTTRQWRGRSVALDPAADVALVLVDGSEPLDWVVIGDGPQAGMEAQHYGYGSDGVLKRGIGRYLGVGGYGDGRVPCWHADTQSVSGDSGGGLFDLAGRLVSVNWGATDRGVSVSTPAQYVSRLLTQYRGGPAQPIQERPRIGGVRPKQPVVLGPRVPVDPLAGFDAEKFVAILASRWPGAPTTIRSTGP